MANLDRLLQRRGRSLDRQLGETWYYNDGGSHWIELRVLIEAETDAKGNPLVEVTTNDRTKTITLYKDPTTIVGGVAMGGVARPVVSVGSFIRAEDMGQPGAPTWRIDRIVGDDLNTWTVQCVQRELSRIGRHAST